MFWKVPKKNDVIYEQHLMCLTPSIIYSCFNAPFCHLFLLNPTYSALWSTIVWKCGVQTHLFACHLLLKSSGTGKLAMYPLTYLNSGWLPEDNLFPWYFILSYQTNALFVKVYRSHKLCGNCCYHKGCGNAGGMSPSYKCYGNASCFRELSNTRINGLQHSFCRVTNRAFTEAF